MHDATFVNRSEDARRFLLRLFHRLLYSRRCRRSRSRRCMSTNFGGFDRRCWRDNRCSSLCVVSAYTADIIRCLGDWRNTSQSLDKVFACVVRGQGKIQVAVKFLEEELQILHSSFNILLWIEKVPYTITVAGFRYQLHETTRTLVRNRPTVEVRFGLDHGPNQCRVYTVIQRNRINQSFQGCRNFSSQNVGGFRKHRRKRRGRVIDDGRRGVRKIGEYNSAV